MDFKYEANIIRSLSTIIRNHHVQKGLKPVHWCLDCASALAEAEVEYAERTSPSIDVAFAAIHPAEVIARLGLTENDNPIMIPIWTTTPWTLPANQAVALNPSLDYVLVQTDNKRFIVAADLLTSVMTRFQIENYKIIGKLTGEQLDGIQLKHPFYDKIVPVVMSDHVTIEAGTGAVHIAPAHGQEDYLVGKKYQLLLDNPVGDDGCFISSTPLFAGLHVSKANDAVIETLKSNGALCHLTTLKHSYPHCWRHKTPLIFRATPQWFISMEQEHLRELALKAIEQVEWVPDWGKARIRTMIQNRPDWCISRQRAWGVPLALFIHKETGELHPDTLSLMEKVAEKVEEKGIEAWFQLDKKALLGDSADHYQQSFDVLDVWFDSGVSHECVLKTRPELQFPADLVLEGSDQHRGWFQSSLLTSLAMNHTASFKTVLTHGFVVDGEGRKMSKSLGNVIAPETVISTMGADILRLWVASIDYRNEITASTEILNRMAEAYRRIRNTMRFLLANLHGFDPNLHLVPHEDMLMIDRYAVGKAYLLQQEIKVAYDTYQFHLVVQKLHQFCITDMGGFYLDIIKDRQYTMPTDSLGRRSAQTALFHITQAAVRWMAPILSFTAEEIWGYLPHSSTASVLETTWYDKLVSLSESDQMNFSFWEKIIAVRSAVNKEIENARNAGKIGSSLEAEVKLYAAPQLKKELDALHNELRFVLITSSATVLPEHNAPLNRLVTDVPGLSLIIDASTHEKCERCWHRTADINANPTYPGICGRCVDNIAGDGEVRQYA